MMVRADSEQASHDDAPIDWLDGDCPLCGRREEEPRFEAADHTPQGGNAGKRFLVVRCRHCATSYTNPRPGPRSIGRFYPRDYKPHRRPSKVRHSPAKPRLLSRLLGRSRERRGELPWDGPGRLLDFGCGSGSYLHRMAAQGWEVTGLDAAVGPVRRIREEYGLRALAGELPHPELQPCTFDVVTMWHSLEHVQEPLATLREAHRLLVPGGKLIVACPNIESWAFRRFGRDWFGLDVPRHLTHFTPTTLLAMLHAAGFGASVVRSIRHGVWMKHSARLAARGGRTGWVHRILGTKTGSKAWAWVLHMVNAGDCFLIVAERPHTL
jgi:2-polyprenyl-3-methyl-5-hydroxy-6-metoxy-1,4-benzoquinol methylase